MPDPMPRIELGPTARCPYCHSAVELVTGAVVYPERPELAERNIWRCVSCDASVGCHRAGARIRGPGGMEVVSDGTLPMGSLANRELRAARKETHRLFDQLWQPSARMSRGDAYVWMANLLGVPTEGAHVASLGLEECVKVQLAVEDLMGPPGEAPELPAAAHWLMRAGIEFAVDSDGHYVVHAGTALVDYWPEQQRWAVRGELLADGQQGLHELIMFCRGQL